MSIVNLEARPALSRPFFHLVLAGLVSFGLSTLYWIAFGVFFLWPFLIVSTGCAAAGAAMGLIAGGRLWVTALAVAILRNIVFLAAMGPW